MSEGHRAIDLRQIPAVPWAWVDEHVYAAIRGCNVKVLQKGKLFAHLKRLPDGVVTIRHSMPFRLVVERRSAELVSSEEMK